MWFDNTESQSLQFQACPRPPCASACLKLPSKLFCGEAKTRFCRATWLAFVSAHARSYICMRHENVSGSFEIPSCFRNVHTLHELACVREVVTSSLPRFLLVYATCRHKKRSKISGEKRFLGLVARPVRRASQGCRST